MEIIKNWDEIEAKGTGDYVKFPAGAYVCVIKGVEEYTSETGSKSLRVKVDIDQGQYKGFFQKQYDDNTSSAKKWNNNSTRYIGLAENALPFFKGFITSVENSNPGYKWNWDEKTLVGKKVGGVYQWEEYEKQDGGKGVKAKLNQFRSIDKLEDVKTDNVKLLNGKYISYDDYQEYYTTASAEEIFGSSIVETDSGEVPFEI